MLYYMWLYSIFILYNYLINIRAIRIGYCVVNNYLLEFKESKVY